MCWLPTGTAKGFVQPWKRFLASNGGENFDLAQREMHIYITDNLYLYYPVNEYGSAR